MRIVVVVVILYIFNVYSTGQYSLTGDATCTSCPSTFPFTAAGTSQSSAADCTDVCPSGYSCSANVQTICPAGKRREVHISAYRSILDNACLLHVQGHFLQQGTVSQICFAKPVLQVCNMQVYFQCVLSISYFTFRRVVFR